MNNTYEFSFKVDSKERHKSIVASGYIEAIEKASLILEQYNDDLDLIGFDNWEDVQDECLDHEISVSDLVETDD